MATRVKVRFTKLHRWHRAMGYYLQYGPGEFVDMDAWDETGQAIRLWRYAWEKAGFGHGRFGYRSFGWAQGGLTTGGFGYGEFGRGEFGYHNEPAEWVTRRSLRDGRYAFKVILLGTNLRADTRGETRLILVRSEPAAPRLLTLVSMSEGTANLRMIGSEDLMN